MSGPRVNVWVKDILHVVSLLDTRRTPVTVSYPRVRVGAKSEQE